MNEHPMTREVFLGKLRHYLRKLPEEELNDAVRYYEEYIDEAGGENVVETLRTLGDPRDIAVQILSERTVLQIDAEPVSARKGLSTLWTVLLSIFAFPIAFPLALAGAAVLFAVAVCILALMFAAVCVVFSFLVAALGMWLGLTLGGLMHFVAGFVVLGQSVLSGLFFIGSGLFCMGLGMLCLPLFL